MRRLLTIGGMVMVFGGIWLPNFGPPRLVGELCSLAGFLVWFLGARLSRKDWLVVGICLGLVTLGVVLSEPEQPDAWLRTVGIVCLLAALFFIGCWLVLRVRRASKARKKELEQSMASES